MKVETKSLKLISLIFFITGIMTVGTLKDINIRTPSNEDWLIMAGLNTLCIALGILFAYMGKKENPNANTFTKFGLCFTCIGVYIAAGVMFLFM